MIPQLEPQQQTLTPRLAAGSLQSDPEPRMRIIETEELHTFYAGANDTVTIRCPQCGTAKNFSAKEFKAPYRGIRATCSCGRTFRCAVEFRHYYRKRVSLPGVFTNVKTGETGDMTVECVSLGGIDFLNHTKSHLIMKDDLLEVSFRLDDARRTLIERRVRITEAGAVNVRAVFLQAQPYDKELGFYLLPS